MSKKEEPDYVVAHYYSNNHKEAADFGSRIQLNPGLLTAAMPAPVRMGAGIGILFVGDGSADKAGKNGSVSGNRDFIHSRGDPFSHGTHS